MELRREEMIDSEITENHPFSYDVLAKTNWADFSSIVEHCNYEAFVQHAADKGFIRLMKSHTVSSKPALVSTVSEGFKVHMSIFDPSDNDKNLSKAWAIIAQTSIKFNIKLVKIIRNDRRELMRSSDKHGKEITWYAFHDNFEPSKIKDFLTTLTIQFIEKGIIPGPKAIHDRYSINNSNYFTYRNDGSISAVDPFESISIDVDNQPMRQNHTQNLLKGAPPARIAMESGANLNEPVYNDDSDSEDKCSKCCPP
jgi:hypothetical protein